MPPPPLLAKLLVSMARRALALLLLRVASVLSECADDYNACTDSPCCKSEGFGCFKRPDKPYAQCRPMPSAPAVCTDDSSWMCPGWELCGARFDDCVQTNCCQSTQDRCYAKSDSYAQCIEAGTCVDKVGRDGAPWQCTELVPAQQCSQSWQDCGSSRCCVAGGFHCYKHSDRYAQCMDTCEQTPSILCKAHDKGLSARAAAPPSAAPPAQCSDAMAECTHSRCCAKSDFRCYQKGAHFAQCLRAGSCTTARSIRAFGRSRPCSHSQLEKPGRFARGGHLSSLGGEVLSRRCQREAAAALQCLHPTRLSPCLWLSRRHPHRVGGRELH